MPGRSGEMMRTPSACAALVGGGGVEPGAQPAVKAQDGFPVGISILLESETSSVRHDHGSGHPRPADRSPREWGSTCDVRAIVGTQARYSVTP